jgi:hypothetical protein
LDAPPKEIKSKEPKDRSMATTYAAIDLPTYPEDAQIIQRDGWYQIITPTFKEISANEVFVSHVKEEEIEKRVEETFARYRKEDLPFKWSIGPMSSPDRLEQEVAKRASESWVFRGMAIDTDFESFREQTRDRLMKSITHPSCEYYLARKNGQSIGAAGTVFKQKHGFLISAVVLKEHRGSGAYRALVQKRLVDLQKRRLPFAVTQARDSTSAPVLERLGFETVFRAKIYRTD